MKTPDQAVQGAWLSFRYGRSLMPVLRVFLLATTLACVAVARSPSMAQRSMLAVAMILAFGLSRRIIAGDRSTGRCWLLFQRPVSPSAHYLRLVCLSGGCILTGLIVAAIAMSVTIALAGGESQLVWGSLAGAIVWSYCLFGVGVGISSLMRDGDFEVLILIYLISSFQSVLADQAGLGPGLTATLERLLFPVDSVFLLWKLFVSGVWSLNGADLAHVLIYPTAWLGVAVLRLRSDSFGEFS